MFIRTLRSFSALCAVRKQISLMTSMAWVLPEQTDASCRSRSKHSTTCGAVANDSAGCPGVPVSSLLHTLVANPVPAASDLLTGQSLRLTWRAAVGWAGAFLLCTSWRRSVLWSFCPWNAQLAAIATAATLTNRLC